MSGIGARVAGFKTPRRVRTTFRYRDDADDDDPLVDQWSLVVPSKEHPVVFVATDGVPRGGDGKWPFSWAMSRDPEVVHACALTLGLRHEPLEHSDNLEP